MPLPSVLKHPLVSVWNSGYQTARTIRNYAVAIGSGRIEHCSVCGKLRPMFYRPRFISPVLIKLWELTPREAVALHWKESCDCSSCGAKLRARRIADVLLDVYPTGARSLREWAASEKARSLRIAEINIIDGLHEVLEGMPKFQASDFTPGVERGATVDGKRCEDFDHLTYEDAFFDLVLTSETLEHVADLRRSLAECMRVLVPGGLHVFTAPVTPHVAKTFPRARIGPNGEVEQLATAICHPGGSWGYPVFTELGVDFPDILREAGFETDIRFGPLSEDNLAQVYVSRKPSEDARVELKEAEAVI